MILDILAIVIYFLDMIVQINSAIIDSENGEMVTNRNKILAVYINTRFFKDLVSSLPIDYLLLAVDN